MSARRPAILACAAAVVCAAAAGCGGSSATRIARTANEAAPPSPVVGSTTQAYPPPDPVSVVSCAAATATSYCTDADGVRVAAVRIGQPCHVSIDPAGVQSGSWRPLGAGTTHLACGAGPTGSACVVSGATGAVPVNGAWDRAGACVTARREGAPCGVDAHTHGAWRQVGGTPGAPRWRCKPAAA